MPVHRLHEEGLGIPMPSPSSLWPTFAAQRWVKQLLLTQSDSDIAQKHSASRFTLTTGRGGRWKLSEEGVPDMTSAVVSNTDEIRELTLDELDEAGGGFGKPYVTYRN